MSDSLLRAAITNLMTEEQLDTPLPALNGRTTRQLLKKSSAHPGADAIEEALLATSDKPATDLDTFAAALEAQGWVFRPAGPPAARPPEDDTPGYDDGYMGAGSS